MVKNVRSLVQNACINSYYLNCKQTSIAEIHLRVWGCPCVSTVNIRYMIQLAIVIFLFVEYLPQDGRNRPKCVGSLPRV